MRAYELQELNEIFYHGTSSCLLSSIKEKGFTPPCYFVKNFKVAEEYAAMGGEWDLQDREEKYKEEHGVSPREIYDVWEMYEKLYPKNCHPIVIEISIPSSTQRISDTGGHGANAFTLSNCNNVNIIKIHKVEW